MAPMISGLFLIASSPGSVEPLGSCRAPFKGILGFLEGGLGLI